MRCDFAHLHRDENLVQIARLNNYFGEITQQVLDSNKSVTNVIDASRCNIAHIVLEMDRILRPGGWVLVRESNAIVRRVQRLAKSFRWRTQILDTENWKYCKDKLLSCHKLLWHN